ncbi:MAG: DNA-3-methyladenine glycosylase [Planctomycetaceae bacterium]|nr:DNA-3-methyladenine glycosylase [Planctomycetaceae bacterium]
MRHVTNRSNGSSRLLLPRDFYARHPAVVARDLLGKLLIRQAADGAISAGRIVEAEAYLSSRDTACHANRGMTRKNATMFGPAGHAYVYMIHARWCLNAVTEEVGQGSAVLIRAIEPLEGLELMQARRRTDQPLDLARGPARLCQALDVTKQFDGWDLTLGRELWIAREQYVETNGAPLRISRSRRIGVTSAHHRLLRFFIAGNPYVSGRRASQRTD